MTAIYWTSTVLVSIMLSLSSYTYIFHSATIDGVRELGFPDFFRVQLAVLKVLAVLLLVVPQVPTAFKDWAYAGVGLFYLTAIVAHTAHGDSVIITLINVMFLLLLAASRFFLVRRTSNASDTHPNRERNPVQ